MLAQQSVNLSQYIEPCWILDTDTETDFNAEISDT